MDYLLNIEGEWWEEHEVMVLNLIINGLPSKQRLNTQRIEQNILCFKPYYKWITF